MSDFKAKMHQIRFRLGLAPDPAGGACSAPHLLAGLRGLVLKGGRQGKGVGKIRELGRRGKEKGEDEGTGGEEKGHVMEGKERSREEGKGTGGKKREGKGGEEGDTPDFLPGLTPMT